MRGYQNEVCSQSGAFHATCFAAAILHWRQLFRRRRMPRTMSISCVLANFLDRYETVLASYSTATSEVGSSGVIWRDTTTTSTCAGSCVGRRSSASTSSTTTTTRTFAGVSRRPFRLLYIDG
jgi:hypothetical protein